MTCCGKVKAVASIARGWLSVWLDEQFRLPLLSYEYHAERQAICLACDEQTWWTRSEYAAWLAAQPVEIVKNIEDLSVLPPLEKRERRKGTKLFCRQCKCWLPAKVRVADQVCPLVKWGGEQNSDKDISLESVNR